MVFSFDVETIPAGPVTLCIEHPEHFTIVLNGRSIESRSDGWWIDPAIAKVVLPNDAFIKGENSLELRMAFSEDKNIEAVYLIGRFGVQVKGPPGRCANCRRRWPPTMSRARGCRSIRGRFATRFP